MNLVTICNMFRRIKMIKYSFLMCCFLIILKSNSATETDCESSTETPAEEGPNDDSADTPSGHIIGGKDAYQGQFKYQVSIRVHKKKKHHCGGSIISRIFVLSAAHCFHKRKKDPSLYYMVLGTVSMKKKGDVYELAKFKMHEQYSKIRKVNDIVLIKSAKPMEFSVAVRPIKISRENVPAGKIVIVSGWGMTDFDKRQFPHKLQYIQAKTISHAQCLHQITAIKKNMHLCTMKMPNTGFCKGDSGGPLAYNNNLIGIVSFAITCAATSPDVYVRVSYYEKWINEKVRQLKYSSKQDIPVFV